MTPINKETPLPSSESSSSECVPSLPENQEGNNDDCHTTTEKTDNEDELRWYFGFGSNMNPKVFGPEGRSMRQITPLDVRVGYIPGWKLCINLIACPIIESGMGNIRRCTSENDQCVHGVAFLLSKEQFDELYRSEGGDHGAYTIQKLKMITYDTTTTTSDEIEKHATNNSNDEDHCNNENEMFVYTLVVPPGDKRFGETLDLPSKRYITLLRDGARHYKLDPKYIEYLDNYPCADPHFIIKYGFLGGVVLPIFSPVILVMITAYVVEKVLFFGKYNLRKLILPYVMGYYSEPMILHLNNVVDFFQRKINWNKPNQSKN